MATNQYEIVFCVVNNGFSETVMASARAAGARGGTVLTARGTANPKAEKFFGVTVLPNKEVVMILVENTIKDAVLHNLYRDVGLKTAGQGIAFTLPVRDVVGLTPIEQTLVEDSAEQSVSVGTSDSAATVADAEQTADIVDDTSRSENR